MSVSGLIEKTVRAAKRLFHRGSKTVTKSLKKGEANTQEVPISWLRKAPGALEKEARHGRTVTVKDGKAVIHIDGRKVRHWPWLRNFKRGLAALLLLVNFLFSQYLITQVGFQLPAMLFFGNCFIIIDYLWKTRREA